MVRELYLWFQLTQSAALGLKSQWKNDPSSVTFVLILLKISFGKKIKHLDVFMEIVIMVTRVGGVAFSLGFDSVWSRKV